MSLNIVDGLKFRTLFDTLIAVCGLNVSLAFIVDSTYMWLMWLSLGNLS